VKLIAGSGGVFVVRRDGEVLFDIDEVGGFPKPGEAAALFG